MYFIFFIVVASMFIVPIYARRVGGSSQNITPAIAHKPQESKTTSSAIPSASSQVVKEDIVKKLEDLLLQEIIDDLWHEKANDLIVELASFDKSASNTYFRKVLDKIVQKNAKKIVPASTQKKVEQEVPIPIKPLEKPSLVPKVTIQQDSNEKQKITKKLDYLLQQEEIDDVWYATIDDLIFDLALIDRNISNEYLKKIRAKTKTIPATTVLPRPGEIVQKDVPPIIPAAMPKGTPSSFATLRPAQGGRTADTPPPPPGAIKKGTPPPPPPPPGQKGTPSSFAKAPSVKTSEDTSADTPSSPSGGMQKGTPPPPPPGAGPKKGGPPPPPPGPMVKGKKPVSPAKGPLAPAAPKGPDPLTIRESYGARQLEKRTTEEIMELFNKLLEALGTYADFWDAIQKKPKLEWENKIGAVKKALLDPKRNIQIDVAKVITDRIAQVKTEKAKEGLAKQAAAEKKEEVKQQEEFSETELIAKIEALKKRANASDFKWLIEFQGNVKKLDKINHEKAIAYEDEFIAKFTGQKRFLPKKKSIEVK